MFHFTDNFFFFFLPSIKLSRILPTAGHFPTQISILEALLRWLVGRFDPQVRRNAAIVWFPHSLYQGAAIELFLERPWTEFFKVKVIN